MKHKKLKLSAILIMSLGLTALQAQEAIPATGGEASGSGGSASYTVGQVVYTTNTGTNGSVAQGVQQPYEIYVVTGIDNAIGINLECTAYPNPATDFLTLKIEGNVQTLHATSQQYIASLYNINGQLIKSIQIEGNETTISMANLPQATYFLKIVKTKHASSQQEVKTIKIIKTQ